MKVLSQGNGNKMIYREKVPFRIRVFVNNDSRSSVLRMISKRKLYQRSHFQSRSWVNREVGHVAGKELQEDGFNSFMNFMATEGLNDS